MVSKCFKNSLASLLVLSTLFLNIGFTEAKGNTHNQVIEKSYDFPVKSGSNEWKKLSSKEEKLKLSQIPENDLENLSTSALVETVLNYPLISDLFVFNSYEQGFKAVSSNFNGLSELAKREDAGTHLIQAYSELKSSHEKKKVSDKTRIKLMVLELLLTQNEFTSQLTSDELDSFRAETKKALEDHISLAATQYVTTPKGTKVEVMALGEQLSSSDKTSIANSVKASYPNAVLLSSATTNYNCHSYAWYSQSTSNTYWMNNPSAYWTDGSYIKTTNPATGNKIYYSTSGNEHTGVITSRLAGPPSGGDMAALLTVTSKWGQAGLYKHNAKDCPYYVSESALKYYTR